MTKVKKPTTKPKKTASSPRFNNVGHNKAKRIREMQGEPLLDENGEAIEISDWHWVPIAMKTRIHKFVPEYIKDFNGARAWMRCGWNAPQPYTEAAELLRHPYAQYWLAKTMERAEEKAIVSRNDVLFGLKKEANAPDSFAADSNSRIAAWKTLGKILGMETTKIEASVDVNGGVMAVPVVGSIEEWEAMAKASQQTLKNSVKDHD